jgi:uncharacterized membrane protein HdeD (DUF308 family)
MREGAMSMQSQASGPADLGSLFGGVAKRWGWLLALGILLLVLGIIGLGMTVALTIASVLFFGFLLLIGGGVQLAHAFTCRGWRSIVMHALIALLYIVAGFAVITDPLVASAALTLLIAILIIAIGVARLVMAWQLRGSRGWGWLLAAGILAVVLGLIIAAHWPISGLWVIGLFVAIEMIAHGWTLILMALALREYRRAA